MRDMSGALGLPERATHNNGQHKYHVAHLGHHGELKSKAEEGKWKGFEGRLIVFHTILNLKAMLTVLVRTCNLNVGLGLVVT